MGGPTGWPGRAGRPFRKGREELGGLLGGPGWVDRPLWRSGSGREALPEDQEALGGPSGGP